MFKFTQSFSSFSSDDLEQAKSFYGDTLGITVKETAEGLELHMPNGARIFIYPKPNHSPAAFTVLNFIVDDIETAVDSLTEAGARFEKYDDEQLRTDSKGIARSEGHGGPSAVAWFKDPAGNFLAVIQE